jgi:hypothetical protein
MFTDNPIIQREGWPKFIRRATVPARGLWAGLAVAVAFLPVAIIFVYWHVIDSEAAAIVVFVASYWPNFLAPVLTPALVAGAIASERERQSWDHIVLSRLTVEDIIWGKLTARLLPLLLITAVMLPSLAVMLVRSRGVGIWSMMMPGSHGNALGPGVNAALTLLPWLIGFGVVFANAVMTLYVSLRARNTRTALLVAYGIAAGGYFINATLTSILFAVTIPLLTSSLAFGHTGGGRAIDVVLFTIIRMLPALLWAIIVPVVMLPMMKRDFGRINMAI